ncbi:MAG TPA: alpha-D-ribose 1-methylphosphonate 5-triphosphate diphosphatase [Devosiaceae bacterium]|nr:alpha-D-ribose 1-methylphosphonate 5-triphosphate diphosphatase [Devosiaceae bacterium]
MNFVADPSNLKTDASLTLANAKLVLPNEVVEGSLSIAGQHIAALDQGASVGAAAIDCEGDYLVPGVVDIHTDHIEQHFTPRPGVRWPAALAVVMAHDWQMLGSGITTVLDSLSIGDYDSGGARAAMLDAAIGAVSDARSKGLLKADHYLHFRCELSDPGLLPLVERYIDDPNLRLLSMMDHTPGQRQWHNLTLYREFRRKKNGRVWSEDEFAAYMDERLAHQAAHVPPSREAVGNAGRARNLVIASHDDTTIADVEQAHADGILISEFPTTMEAARRARELGMKNVMGAPNVVLGKSHSGNVSAGELADAGLLDGLTSDYVPASLLHAAFILAGKGLPLPQTMAMVTSTPADLIGFSDRGRLAAGLRADVLRVRIIDGVPVIRGIWVAGRQYL